MLLGSNKNRMPTIINDDIEKSPSLVLYDALQEGYIRLISNIQFATAFLFNGFPMLFGTVGIILNERYLARWEEIGP